MNHPFASKGGKRFSEAWFFAAAWLATGSALDFHSARADTTNLACIADTFIIARNPDNNAGGYTDVAAGRDGNIGDGTRRALYRFDLSGVPAGSLITSAVFRCQVVKQALSGDVDSTFALHAVQAEWGEGTGFGTAGTLAGVGDATWSSRRHTIAAWISAGGDFGPALASTFVSNLGTYSWTSNALIAAVQVWLDQPSQNFGLLLRSQSEGTSKTARRFGSREGGQPAVLQLGFDPPAPPEPTLVLQMSATTNDVMLEWTSTSAQRFDVFYRSDLMAASEWRRAATDVPASTNGTTSWTDAPYVAGPAYEPNSHLFYSVGTLPAAGPALPLAFDLVATNLASPTVLTHAGDGSGRLFVADQTGQIRIIDAGGALLPQPFLDVSSLMTNLTVFAAFGYTNAGLNPFYDERGLLGLVFHPAYTNNGRFFIYHSSPKTGPGIDHESVLVEYAVSSTNANLADPASATVLLRVDEPEFNHNGGSLLFGPDGYLYVSLGDGGGGGDVHGTFGNGQNVTNLLGKVLRLDVDSASPYAIPPDNPFVGGPGREEIYAYGFRNPWKMSFDRGGSNELIVADVGQNVWEEINIVRRGGNYGWRILEGTHAYDASVADLLGIDIGALDAPIHEYKHGPLGISIIGGFMYRGPGYPALVGRYVFGDFSTSFVVPDGALFYIEETRPGIWQRFEFPLPGGARLGRFVKGFGEDEAGELYLLSTTALGPSGTSGDIRRLRAP
jgi:glucose/arabinose dehydrogenase